MILNLRLNLITERYMPELFFVHLVFVTNHIVRTSVELFCSTQLRYAILSSSKIIVIAL